MALFIPVFLAGSGVVREPTKSLDWGFVGDKNHWVFNKDFGVVPNGTAACPGNDMVEIKGDMLWSRMVEFSYIEYLQNELCTKWTRKNWPSACASFDKRKWSMIQENFPRREMHYCIDPFEWPNRIGAAPWIMVSWNEAKNLCEARGKRLCTEEEWTFACEGEEALPYPNGYEREPQKCGLDKTWIQYDESVMLPRGTQKCGEEMQRLWQGRASGSDPQCSSPFGVQDMTGNVDEWTIASKPSTYPSILKGGYWAGSKNRCRASTRVHGPDFMFYQQGFRCCADVKR